MSDEIKIAEPKPVVKAAKEVKEQKVTLDDFINENSLSNVEKRALKVMLGHRMEIPQTKDFYKKKVSEFRNIKIA